MNYLIVQLTGNEARITDLGVEYELWDYMRKI